MFLKAKRMSGLAAAGLVFLVGCGEDAAPADGEPCDGDWCDFHQDEGAYHGAYHGSYFCFVEHVRELVVNEDLDVDELVADLPSWASGNTRADGGPVIVDVSLTDPNDTGERTDAILEALEDRGIEIAWHELDECRDTVSQEMVEESEGPYQGPVHPDDD